MEKTKQRVVPDDMRNRLTVNAETLAAMLDCGRVTAVKIGTEAGARIKIGNRVLFKVDAIERYLDGCMG